MGDDTAQACMLACFTSASRRFMNLNSKHFSGICQVPAAPDPRAATRSLGIEASTRHHTPQGVHASLASLPDEQSVQASHSSMPDTMAGEHGTRLRRMLGRLHRTSPATKHARGQADVEHSAGSHDSSRTHGGLLSRLHRTAPATKLARRGDNLEHNGGNHKTHGGNFIKQRWRQRRADAAGPPLAAARAAPRPSTGLCLHTLALRLGVGKQQVLLKLTCSAWSTVTYHLRPV